VQDWIDCNEKMPEENQVFSESSRISDVVIVRWHGDWRGRGTSGVTELYTHNGKWWNYPENVKITHWIEMPTLKSLSQEN